MDLKTLALTRVLIVEDDEAIARLMQTIFVDLPRLDIVRSPEKALLMARRYAYDLVLLDIHLGERRDGTDLLRELRTRGPYQEIPFVALTADAKPGDRKRYLDEGFDGYVAKPFTQEMLITGIIAAFQD